MIPVGGLIHVLILLICVGLIFWLLWWLIGFVGLPEPFRKVATVILAVAAVIFLISVLAYLAGFPLWSW